LSAPLEMDDVDLFEHNERTASVAVKREQGYLTTSSTCMEAQWPWGTPSVAAAPGCSLL
jgi:hypothetical protein